MEGLSGDNGTPPIKGSSCTPHYIPKTSELLPGPGDTCLYLGASSGTTVSHIHDMVCGSNNHHNGQIIAVEISPRMMRDLSSLAEDRPGLIPILTDARETQAMHPL